MIYAKRTFRGPEQVFRHLSRYTHRIAISDSRIVAFDGERVSYRHRKPRRPGQCKPRYGTATVAVDEFVRRFLLHVLPDRLHRIRHFGILANSCRATTLESAREALGPVGCTVADRDAVEDLILAEVFGENEDHDGCAAAPVTCPNCGAVLRHVGEIPRRQTSYSTRGPPPERSSHRPQP